MKDQATYESTMTREEIERVTALIEWMRSHPALPDQMQTKSGQFFGWHRWWLKIRKGCVKCLHLLHTKRGQGELK